MIDFSFGGSFTEKEDCTYRYKYWEIQKDLDACVEAKDESGFLSIIRTMSKKDLFFLLYFVFGIHELNDKWLLSRVYDIQDTHDKTIDLWPRGFYKSTIITFGLSIWKLINNPEARIGIFSHTRNLAKAHLRRLKVALETNELLLSAFHDVFYHNPSSKGGSPKWSEDEGLIIKRKGTYIESSVEAWALVDSSPVGKHFTDRVYDDIVEKETVSTPEQIRKTLQSFYESLNLSSRDGQMRIVGTHWSHFDPYVTLREGGLYQERIWGPYYPKSKNDEPNIPIYKTEKELEEIRLSMDDYTYSCQIENDPKPNKEKRLNTEWLRWYRNSPFLNLYAVVDPAKGKERSNDFFVMIVYGVDSLRNFFIKDIVRDKLNLKEKWEVVSHKVLEWGLREVGYEIYGQQSEDEYFNEQMEQKGIYFDLIPMKGNIRKETRIMDMVAYLKSGRLILPHSISYKRKWDGQEDDIIKIFIDEEYVRFPFGKHDDIIDCMSRMFRTEMLEVTSFPTVKSSMKKWGDRDPLEPEHQSSPVDWLLQ